MSDLLDAEVIELLSSMDSFFIQQRVRMIEAITGGCWEQPNVYDVFDQTTNKRVMIIKEESDNLSRCCCAPGHSIFVKFYLVGKDAPELKPGQKVDWSYEPSGSPFMTFEREGCDCGGPCPKPCIGCFACMDCCIEHGTLHAGDLSGGPGDKQGGRERSKLLGETIQPHGGGGFKPVMQMMERSDTNDASGKTELFAATRGPCCTGGLAKLCIEAVFGFAKVTPDVENNSKAIHKANFGDFATVTKLAPRTMGQGIRELFTDSDLFDVKFNAKDVTPQQKATVLGQMIHLDYMFFENDNDVCSSGSDGKPVLTLCNFYCYGCLCPCVCKAGRDL